MFQAATHQDARAVNQVINYLLAAHMRPTPSRDPASSMTQDIINSVIYGLSIFGVLICRDSGDKVIKNWSDFYARVSELSNGVVHPFLYKASDPARTAATYQHAVVIECVNYVRSLALDSNGFLNLSHLIYMCTQHTGATSYSTLPQMLRGIIADVMWPQRARITEDYQEVFLQDFEISLYEVVGVDEADFTKVLDAQVLGYEMPGRMEFLCARHSLNATDPYIDQVGSAANMTSRIMDAYKGTFNQGVTSGASLMSVNSFASMVRYSQLQFSLSNHLEYVLYWKSTISKSGGKRLQKTLHSDGLLPIKLTLSGETYHPMTLYCGECYTPQGIHVAMIPLVKKLLARTFFSEEVIFTDDAEGLPLSIPAFYSAVTHMTDRVFSVHGSIMTGLLIMYGDQRRFRRIPLLRTGPTTYAEYIDANSRLLTMLATVAGERMNRLQIGAGSPRTLPCGLMSTTLTTHVSSDGVVYNPHFPMIALRDMILSTGTLTKYELRAWIDSAMAFFGGAGGQARLFYSAAIGNALYSLTLKLYDFPEYESLLAEGMDLGSRTLECIKRFSRTPARAFIFLYFALHYAVFDTNEWVSYTQVNVSIPRYVVHTDLIGMVIRMAELQPLILPSRLCESPLSELLPERLPFMPEKFYVLADDFFNRIPNDSLPNDSSSAITDQSALADDQDVVVDEAALPFADWKRSAAYDY